MRLHLVVGERNRFQKELDGREEYHQLNIDVNKKK